MQMSRSYASLLLVFLLLSGCTSMQRGGSLRDNEIVPIVEARMLYDQGETEGAIAHLQNWVDDNSYTREQDVAYELIVTWLLENKQTAEAKRIASFFIARHKDSPSVQRIIDLFDKDQVQQTSPSEFEKIPAEELNSEENPMDSHIEGGRKTNDHESQALYYFHIGDLEQAKAHAEKAKTDKASLLLKEIAFLSEVNLKSIGIVLPLSGPLAPFGKKVLSAIAIGLQTTLNATEEIYTVTKDGMQIVVADSKGDQLETAQRVDALVKKYNVALIIGDISNDKTMLAAMRCQQYGVPMLNLSRYPLIAGLGDYVFVVNASAEQQIVHLVNYAMKVQNHQRFAVLFPRHNYGITMSRLFVDEVVRQGGSITGLEAYDAHETTFFSPVQKLVGKYYLGLRPEYAACTSLSEVNARKACEKSIPPIVDFDALFIPDFKLALVIPALMQEDILITTDPRAQAAFKGATKISDPHYVQLLGTNSWNDKNTLDKIANNIQGAYFVDSMSFTEDAKIKAFATTFSQIYGQSPTNLEVFAHDAALLAHRLLHDGKIASRVELREKIASFNDRVGLLERISFKQNGELDAPELGFVIKNGETKPVHHGS